MTTDNPFRTRIAQAAQEGYLGRPRSTYGSHIPAGYAPTPGYRPQPSAAVGYAPQESERKMTAGMVQLAHDLLTERDLAAETRPKFAARLRMIAANWDTELGKLTFRQGRALVDTLKELPMKAKPVVSGIPAGHYAVEYDGNLNFYKVDRPEEGRWAGYTFVEKQLSDDYVRISRTEADAVKVAIAQDPKAAAIAYGKLIGRCAICHRTLTNEDSRAAGIGPVCAANQGW